MNNTFFIKIITKCNESSKGKNIFVRAVASLQRAHWQKKNEYKHRYIIYYVEMTVSAKLKTRLYTWLIYDEHYIQNFFHFTKKNFNYYCWCSPRIISFFNFYFITFFPLLLPVACATTSLQLILRCLSENFCNPLHYQAFKYFGVRSEKIMCGARN